MEATEARGQGFADGRTQAAKCSTQVAQYVPDFEPRVRPTVTFACTLTYSF
jgi:hypothetical protein